MTNRSPCAGAQARGDPKPSRPSATRSTPAGGSDGHSEAKCAWLDKLIHHAHLRMILLMEQAGSKVFLEEYCASFAASGGKFDYVYWPDGDPDFTFSEC